MLYVFGLFEKKETTKPLIAVTYDGSNIEYYTFFLPKTNLKLFEIYENCNRFKEVLLNNELVLHDYKSFIESFNLPYKEDVYDLQIDYLNNINYNKSSNIKSLLAKIVKSFVDIKPLLWNNIIAKSQYAYYHMENIPLTDGINRLKPIYNFNYSGRSKTTNFNIHSYIDDLLKHENHEYNYFIHFDWIAADLRIASIFSKDLELEKAFSISDPYSYIIDNNPELNMTRDDCKSQLLGSLYALNFDNLFLEFYPKLKEYIKSSLEFINRNGFSSTLLDRKFFIEDTNNVRSIFNASIQGSTAHAMQILLDKLYLNVPNHVVTEIHDAVILTCNKESLKPLINLVLKFMRNPFLNILVDNPSFPVRVSIGTNWRKWERYKEYR